VSIANVIVSGDVALCAVDTLAQPVRPAQLAEQPRHLGKMFPLPHLPAIIVGRGYHPAILLVASVGQDAENFDDLSYKIGDTMLGARAVAELDPRSRDLPRELVRGGEIDLVGYSNSWGRIVCWSFSLSPDAVDVRRIMSECSIGPWGQTWGEMPSPRTVDDLVRVATQQVQLQRREHPAAVIGGSLIVAELPRDEMKIWTAAELP